jgi:hypothetical protein
VYCSTEPGPLITETVVPLTIVKSLYPVSSRELFVPVAVTVTVPVPVLDAVLKVAVTFVDVPWAIEIEVGLTEHEIPSVPEHVRSKLPHVGPDASS